MKVGHIFVDLWK